MNAPVKLVRARHCLCGHIEQWHEQPTVSGGPRGACTHGCGCTAFHKRRQRDEVDGADSVSACPSATPLATALAAWHELRRAGDAWAAQAALVLTASSPQAPFVAPKVMKVVRATAPLVREGDHRAVTVRPHVHGKLQKGPHVILTAIAQHPKGVTRQKLTVLTGFKRSTRDAYLQRLFAAALVDIAGGLFVASSDGRAALGSDFAPLPTGGQMRDNWARRLPEGEARIFQILVDVYPVAGTRDAIGVTTGFRRSTRDAYLQRLRSRGLVQFVGRGEVKASAELFE